MAFSEGRSKPNPGTSKSEVDPEKPGQIATVAPGGSGKRAWALAPRPVDHAVVFLRF